MPFFLLGVSHKTPHKTPRKTPGPLSLALTALVLAIGALSWPLLAVPAETWRQTLLGSLLGLAATAAGALLIGLPGQRQPRVLELALSFSGGMMLAAALFSLFLPAVSQAGTLLPGLKGALAVAGATAAGAGLMCLLERHVPHGHPVAGETGPGHQQLSRLWLFVLAIALHNVPEGLAVGVSFAGGGQDATAGLANSGASVSLAIALQDLPEGYAMAIVLLKLGLSRAQAMGWSLLAGLLEPVGAMVGLALGSLAPLAYPLLLAVAGGAMMFVVVHEVIPETHTRARAPTAASLWLLAGFLLLWLVEQQLP